MQDFLKETGKYLYDISKIVLGIGIVTPLIKGSEISIWCCILLVFNRCNYDLYGRSKMTLSTAGLVMLAGVILVTVAIYRYDKNKHLGQAH